VAESGERREDLLPGGDLLAAGGGQLRVGVQQIENTF